MTSQSPLSNNLSISHTAVFRVDSGISSSQHHHDPQGERPAKVAISTDSPAMTQNLETDHDRIILLSVPLLADTTKRQRPAPLCRNVT